MHNDLAECLFLFDIDGTILSTEGDGKKAFVKACEIILDDTVNDDIDFRGGIDYLVLEEILFAEPGKGQPQEIMGRFKSHYLDFLQDLSEQNNWLLFEKADKIIKHLHNVSNIALVTGNIKEGAFVKLDHFSLSPFFGTGGFGDNASSRTNLAYQALNEAEKYYNRNFDKKKVFLIGDTQKDIDSALENSIIPLFMDHYRKYEEIKGNELVHYFPGFEELMESIDNNMIFSA